MVIRAAFTKIGTMFRVEKRYVASSSTIVGSSGSAACSSSGGREVQESRIRDAKSRKVYLIR